jgi:hypothetical protein
VKYESLRNARREDNRRVRGKIKTKSFESSCSFLGINFSFIYLVNIHFDFTIILEKSSLLAVKNFTL